MHPGRHELRRYCDGRVTGAEREALRVHVESCDFCREFCSEFRALTESVDRAILQDAATLATDAADRMFDALRAGRSVRLVPFTAVDQPPALLAADGSQTSTPRLENLGTLYSEEPEVILRIMRDHVRDREYLQLVSDDERLVTGVLVRVPEIGLNILTDQEGRADIEWQAVRDLARHEWSIKLPDAEFSLEPLEFDPDRVEYQEETVLTTERGDQVGIRFEGRASGKRVAVRILRLEGQETFGTVHVMVSQAGGAVAAQLALRDQLHMDLSSPDDLIAIRIFAD